MNNINLKMPPVKRYKRKARVVRRVHATPNIQLEAQDGIKK